MIQSQLLQKPTAPLYPENEDIFLEFVEGSNPNDLHLPLTQAIVKITHEGDLKLHSLELMSQNRTILRLHGEEVVIQFLNFLLSHAINAPLSKVLKAIHIPSATDLKQVIDTTLDLKQTYQKLLAKVQASISNAFKLHVTPKISSL